MTMTADHTQSPVQAAQEHVEAIAAEMTTLNAELQGIPAAATAARRREDVPEAMRLAMREQNIKERLADLVIAHVAAEVAVLDGQARAADVEAKAAAEAMILARQEYDAMERELAEKKGEVLGLLARSRVAQQRATDLSHRARDRQCNHADLMAARRAGGHG